MLRFAGLDHSLGRRRMSIGFKNLRPSRVDRLTIVLVLMIQLVFEPAIDTWSGILGHGLPITMLTDASHSHFFRPAQRYARTRQADGDRGRLLLLRRGPGQLGTRPRQDGRGPEGSRRTHVCFAGKSRVGTGYPVILRT